MRSSSVFSFLKSAIVAATLVLVLAASAQATPRQSLERFHRQNSVERFIQIVQRLFGVNFKPDISIPTPG
jgi:hypothetical protein